MEWATEGWDVEVFAPLRISFETPFGREIVDMRTERYVRDVVTRVKEEMSGVGTEWLRGALQLRGHDDAPTCEAAGTVTQCAGGTVSSKTSC